MDLLEDRLFRARATGATFARSVRRPPWGLRLPGATQLAVHTMVRGTAWVWTDRSQAIEVRPGDVVLVRGGCGQHVADRPDTVCQDLDTFRRFDAPHGSPEVDDRNVLLCAAYRFAADVGHGLVADLPQILHTRPTAASRLHATVDLFAREIDDEEPGRQTVLDRLLDVLLVQLLRGHFDDPTVRAPRWYAANVDRVLGPAVQAMHANPGQAWTVSDLAAASAVSRATFARTFRSVLGQTPMQYLTDWRMTLARDALRTTDATLVEIANQSGYSSPYAFSTAFARHHGQPPGRFRRAARATAPPVG